MKSACLLWLSTSVAGRQEVIPSHGGEHARTLDQPPSPGVHLLGDTHAHGLENPQELAQSLAPRTKERYTFRYTVPSYRSTIPFRCTVSVAPFPHTFPLHRSVIPSHYTVPFHRFRCPVPLYRSVAPFRHTVPLHRFATSFRYTVSFYNAVVDGFASVAPGPSEIGYAGRRRSRGSGESHASDRGGAVGKRRHAGRAEATHDLVRQFRSGNIAVRGAGLFTLMQGSPFPRSPS